MKLHLCTLVAFVYSTSFASAEDLGKNNLRGSPLSKKDIDDQQRIHGSLSGQDLLDPQQHIQAGGSFSKPYETINANEQPDEIVVEGENDNGGKWEPPQSKEESWFEDTKLIAVESGWTFDETSSFLKLQAAFKNLVSQVKDIDTFLEAQLPEAPGDFPKLLFKDGLRPGRFDKLIAAFESENNINVNIVQTKRSLVEQQTRLESIIDKLRELGFGDAVSAIMGDKLQIAIQKPVDDKSITTTDPERGDVGLDQIDEVAAKLLDLPIDDFAMYGLQIDIYDEETEIGDFEHTRGGRKIYGNDGQCSTAFSVRQKSTGTTGILSAGHCGSAMNTYDAESSGLHGPVESDYSLSHKESYTGTYGDFAWYTTSHWELPEYWASPSSKRMVTGWDFYPSVNEWVCVYSRMQGRRSCSQILSISVDVDYTCCPPMTQMVATKNDKTVPGDSGSNWSWGTTAYGVHSGDAVIGGVRRNVYSEMYWLMAAGAVFDNDIELLCDGPCEVHIGVN